VLYVSVITWSVRPTMPTLAKAKSATRTRKSAPNVKALQALLKSMEREVAKLGKELEKSRQQAAQTAAPKPSKPRDTASARTPMKRAKKVTAPRKASKGSRLT
jgi:hypothetical protein